MSDNVASDDNDTEEANLTEVKEREREHDVIRGGGDVVGSVAGVVPELGPFHPLLILSNLNAVARREREKAPGSKHVRYRMPPDLFNVPLGHAVPTPRTCGAVFVPLRPLCLCFTPLPLSVCFHV